MQELPNYEFIEEIGRGSFANVYLARHNVLGNVAVKSVNITKLNKKLLENLASEIHILKSFHHIHITKLYDIIKQEKFIHLVMEYCELGDLSTYIKQKGMVHFVDRLDENETPFISKSMENQFCNEWGGLNEEIVRHFLRQLGSSMEFLRSNSLIHRDLKPQNILLTPGPQFNTKYPISDKRINLKSLPILKLADFGFARALPSQSMASTLCGSPLYMAPEILRGGKYDEKVDLWSLGAILYELLYGRPPFKAQNHIDLLKKIERGDGYIRFPGEEFILQKESLIRTNNSLVNPSGRASSPFLGSPHHRVDKRTLPDENLSGEKQISLSYRSKSLAIPSPSQKHSSRDKVVSEDLRDLMRKLLKRNPSERIDFPEFFAHQSFFVNRPIEDVFQHLQETPTTISPILSISMTPIIENAQQIYSTSLPAHLTKPSTEANQIYSTSPNKQEFLASSNTRKIGGLYISDETKLYPLHLSSSSLRKSTSRKSCEQASTLSSKRASRESISSPTTIKSLFNETTSGIQKLTSFLPRLSLFGQTTTQKRLQSAANASEDYVFIEKKAVEVNVLADQIAGSMLHTNTPSIVFQPLNHRIEHVKSLIHTFSQCGLRAYCIHVLIDTMDKAAPPEEFFGLYLLCMGLYQQCMDVAKIIWEEQKKEGDIELIEELSKGVNWVRDQFNSCFERADELKEALAQGDDGNSRTETRMAIYVVYDTYLEISYQSGIHEVNGKFKYAADGYQRSIMLLEAILAARNVFEGDEDSAQFLMLDSDYVEVEKELRDLHTRMAKIRVAMKESSVAG